MAAKYMFLILLLAVGLGYSAQSFSCPELVKKYGNKLSLPQPVASFFHGNTVNLEVSTSSGTITANGRVGMAGIEKLTCGSASADFTVSLNEKAVNTLVSASSSKRTSTFISMMKKGEIRLAAHGYIQSMKLRLAQMVLGD